jgi:ceramide glucosyltransferase
MPSSSAPGVTIIRPLCGLDNNLFHTLEAAMKLSYPRYEVIFALQDEGDEAIPVVKMIMEKYPEVSARIIIGASSPGKFRGRTLC